MYSISYIYSFHGTVRGISIDFCVYISQYYATIIQIVHTGSGVLLYNPFPYAWHIYFPKINGWGIKELGNRENRFIPYGLTILSYLGGLLTMYRIHTPRYMSGIILAVLICMVLCTLVNLKLKVSTHAASSGMMVGGLLSYSFLFQFNPVWWLAGFILLAGMLCTARIIVRQHNYCTTTYIN